MRFLDRFRRRQAPRLSRGEPFSTETDDALYVHLAADEGILVIRGETGEQFWTDRNGLRTELKALKARGGLLLYSREAADAEPPEHINETFRLIVDLEPPAIQLVEDPHPEAFVPPAERRTITRG